jgi:hypothetical protein
MISGIREPGNHDLWRYLRCEESIRQNEAQHAVIRAEIEQSVLPGDPASAQTGTELLLLICSSIAIVVAKTDDSERRISIARTVDRDEYVAPVRDCHVPCARGGAVDPEIRHDNGAEPGRQRDAGIVRIALQLRR